MRKIGKKAFTGIFKLAAFALAAILLFFLIKNQWNVGLHPINHFSAK